MLDVYTWEPNANSGKRAGEAAVSVGAIERSALHPLEHAA